MASLCVVISAAKMLYFLVLNMNWIYILIFVGATVLYNKVL